MKMAMMIRNNRKEVVMWWGFQRFATVAFRKRTATSLRLSGNNDPPNAKLFEGLYIEVVLLLI